MRTGAPDLPPAKMSSTPAVTYIRVHGREEPAVSRQSVPDCQREQTYIRRGIVCYVNYEICYLVHLN